MDIMALLLLFHAPLAWLGLGVLLMIAEVLSGEGSLLAFGLSALSVALSALSAMAAARTLERRAVVACIGTLSPY